MSRDLYHDTIMGWAKASHAAGRLDAPDATATVDNPLCGDRVTVDGRVDGTDRLTDVAVQVRGCALCQAAGSMIGKLAVGQSAADLAAAGDQVTALLKQGAAAPPAPWDVIEAFRPVAGHRARHDCVILPFKALRKVLETAHRPATTGRPPG